MSAAGQGRISIKQSGYLALTVLCFYYPISIYVNVPFAHWRQVPLVAWQPAILYFVFFTGLILTIDWVIDRAERVVGPGILEFQPGTIALSIGVAAVAVVLSQFLFKLNYKAWEIFVDVVSPESRSSPGEPPQLWNALRRTSNGFTALIAVSVFYLLINRKSQARVRDMRLQAEKLMKENAVAQLEALKNQVSPHFLFNSLSILSSLVHTDATLAEKFIEQLSRAYRYILDQKDNDTISLKTELDFIRSYSFLLKIRFEDKFDVKPLIPDQTAVRYLIAPLTLQLLVENCVKHNRMSTSEPLIVTIGVKGDYLIVSNPLRPRTDFDSGDSTGIGLSNVIRRYQLLTDKEVKVEQDGGMFTVKIPLI